MAYRAVQQVFRTPAPLLLAQRPRVSVVVCSYNGGATLDECLRSLSVLDYPDYEIIVVDDGSTDRTREVLGRFPDVCVVHQDHRGLSVARNAGLRQATGAVVAYTDSDCVADRGWLTHLVDQLLRSGAAAVGGPNLTPEDGWLAACVAAAPGQPMHVLESDQVAEHIPGCNMAFRREALEAIKGFDPQFKKAGDDVDICWRLQHEGLSITFAPGAFVWHHRRQDVRSYLRQQAGYGEAEALLQFKHPDKFNGRGDGKWRGVMYGNSIQGLQLALPIVYRGHVRHRDVPVPLPAGRRPLGDAARHARMAGGRRAARGDGSVPAPRGVGRRGGPAGPLAAGRGPAGGADASGPGPTTPERPGSSSRRSATSSRSSGRGPGIGPG